MDAFVARQPIFDRDLKVFAYELLFRSGLESFCPQQDLSQASCKVISDSVHLTSLEAITEGCPAFVNVTRDIILNEFALFLPTGRTVLELPETLVPDGEILAACERLKGRGFRIALDHFVCAPELEPLFRLADFIKVDMLQTQGEEHRGLVRRFAPARIPLVAEKVETREEYEDTRQLGYSYFQGFFFAKPAILQMRDIPSCQLHGFRILQEIHRPDLDFAGIERIIKQDMSLCYKLLRYINSAYFGIQSRVSSIRQALALLGETAIRKWVSLIVFAGMADDKPQELVGRAVERARFCETLAPHARLIDRADDCFLMGMFSLIDAVLDRPLPDLLADLPLASDIKDALLGVAGPLRDLLLCVLEYEQGNWAQLSEIAADLGIFEGILPEAYQGALAWSRENFRQTADVV